MESKNEFILSKSAVDKIRSFLISNEGRTGIHNINAYWLNRTSNMNFKFACNQVIVENDHNLPSRIISGKPAFLPSNLNRVALNLMRHIQIFYDKIVNILEIQRIKNELREVNINLTYEKEKVFHYDFWKNNANKIKIYPLNKILNSWPVRTFIMMRAFDVIFHFMEKSDHKELKILEIGSGPSILAGIMMYLLGSKHVLIDLPEQISIGYSMLSEFFPNKNLKLPNEAVSSKNLLKNTDAAFITPEQFNLLKGQKFDIIINMFSFQEMSYDTINEYFSLMRKHIKPEGIFYSLNRVSKFNKFDNCFSEVKKYPWKLQDKFLHDSILNKKWGNVKIAGGECREIVVSLSAMND